MEHGYGRAQPPSQGAGSPQIVIVIIVMVMITIIIVLILILIVMIVLGAAAANPRRESPREREFWVEMCGDFPFVWGEPHPSNVS